MTKKKFDQVAYNKKIRDRNYRFEKMSPAQQRVRIAKDIIEMLEAKKLSARCGVYLEADGRGELDAVVYDVQSCYEEDDVDSLERQKKAEATPLHTLLEKVESCTVCAIGSAFVAGVLRANKLTVGDIGGRYTSGHKQREYLERFFTKKQLGLIEAAFERSSKYASKQGVGYAVTNAAVEFGGAHVDDNIRLEAIFQNIIDSKGTFTP